MGYADVLAGLAGPKAVGGAATAGKKTTLPVPAGSGNEGNSSGIDPRTGRPFQFSPNGSGGEGIWIKDGTNMSGADPTTGLGGSYGVDSGPPSIQNNLPQLLSHLDWAKSIGYQPDATLSGGTQTYNADTGAFDSTGSLEAYMKGQGLTIGSLSGESSGQNDILQAFNASGQAVGKTETIHDNADAFGIGALALGGVAGLAAAGVGGAGAAAGGLATDATGATVAEGAAGAGYGAGGAAWAPTAGGLAGTGLPEYAAYTGPGSAGYSVAGDVAVAPASAETGMGLAEGAYPASITGAGGAGGGGSVADLSSGIYSDYGAGLTGAGGAGTSITGSTGAVGASGEAMGTGAAAAGSSGTGLFGTGVSGQQLGQLASSLYGLYQGNQIKTSANNADPFAKYRGMYGDQLMNLMKDPSSVTSLPGYQASQQAAEQALTRNLAAQGLTGSGAAAEALAKEGAQFQDKYYQETIATLSNLAGAGINNANTSLAGQAAGDNTINQSLNNLVKIWGATGGSSGGSDWGSLLSSFFGG